MGQEMFPEPPPGKGFVWSEPSRCLQTHTLTCSAPQHLSPDRRGCCKGLRVHGGWRKCLGGYNGCVLALTEPGGPPGPWSPPAQPTPHPSPQRPPKKLSLTRFPWLPAGLQVDGTEPGGARARAWTTPETQGPGPAPQPCTWHLGGTESPGDLWDETPARMSPPLPICIGRWDRVGVLGKGSLLQARWGSRPPCVH